MMTLNNLQLNQRHIMAIAIALSIIVFMTFCYDLSSWYWDWKLAHQTITAKVNMDDSSARMLARIPDQHLFGLSATGDMPITNLQLRVTGIAREANAQGENISRAYVSIAGAPSRIFQVGQSLPDGVKINDITPDTVILENGGKLEKLPLPREKLQFKSRGKNEDN
jgi:general secretion pathway protein C